MDPIEFFALNVEFSRRMMKNMPRIYVGTLEQIQKINGGEIIAVSFVALLGKTCST